MRSYRGQRRTGSGTEQIPFSSPGAWLPQEPPARAEGGAESWRRTCRGLWRRSLGGERAAPRGKAELGCALTDCGMPGWCSAHARHPGRASLACLWLRRVGSDPALAGSLERVLWSVSLRMSLAELPRPGRGHVGGDRPQGSGLRRGSATTPCSAQVPSGRSRAVGRVVASRGPGGRVKWGGGAAWGGILAHAHPRASCTGAPGGPPSPNTLSRGPRDTSLHPTLIVSGARERWHLTGGEVVPPKRPQFQELAILCGANRSQTGTHRVGRTGGSPCVWCCWGEVAVKFHP